MELQSPPALFVDLPNFYSNLLRSELADRGQLKTYFVDWLDFDLLTLRLTDSFSGIWIFYSGQRLGPKDERLSGQELRDYIKRINSLEGVTARDVGIRRRQKERVPYTCAHCNATGDAYVETEKGVDAALIVHLFETKDTWSRAFVLSADSDFMPAVASLRRRGKIIVGAGFPALTSDALIRECYSYVDLVDAFLAQDVALYEMFRVAGLAEQWLTCGRSCDSARYGSSPLMISVKMESESAGTVIHFRSQPQISMGDVNKQVTNFERTFGRYVQVQREGRDFKFAFSPHAYTSAVRRFDQFAAQIEGLEKELSSKSSEFRTYYQPSRRGRHYQPVLQSEQT